MEQCPIKEMEILFECVQDTENSLFEPIPAKKVRPEWFKKLPMSVDNYGKPTETIKKCPATEGPICYRPGSGCCYQNGLSAV